MLHADADFSVAVESSVETHNVGGVTLVQHLKLPNDLVPDGWFDFQVDQLVNKRVCLRSGFHQRPEKLKQISHLMQVESKRSGYLPRHDQPGWSVRDLEYHPSVAGPQLADLLKVVVFQLSHLLLLGQKSLQAFSLLLIQLQLLQLLLQCLQVCSRTNMTDK